MWAKAVAAIGLLSLTACGGGGFSPSASVPTGSASGSSALAPAATITTSDQGKSVQVHVGQVVNVALKADGGMDNWQVTAPDPAILAPAVNPAAAAAKGVTLRAFKAVAPGTATLSATDRPSCNPGQACSHLIRGFSASVVVVR